MDTFSILHTERARILMRSCKPIIAYFFFVIAIGFSASCSASHSTVASQSRLATPSANAVDINRASTDELARIPGLGPKLAAEIVKFREEHGRFRRPEHLLLIRGMSDRRYREISTYIKTE